MINVIDAHSIFEVDKHTDVFLTWNNSHNVRAFAKMRDLRLEIIYERQEDASTIWFTVGGSNEV